MARLASARSRRQLGGRPKQLDVHQRQLIVKLYKAREHTVQEILPDDGYFKANTVPIFTRIRLLSFRNEGL